MKLLDRVRARCLALPEVTERPSHGAPTWFVRGRSTFVTLHVDGHHDNDFPHLWCAAPPGAQQELVAEDPARFFRPPYVGGRGGSAYASTARSTGPRSTSCAATRTGRWPRNGWSRSWTERHSRGGPTRMII